MNSLSRGLRCWCEIDFKNLTHNLRAIRRYIDSRCQIFCVVKANAYGHGLVSVAQFVQKTKLCYGFACANVDEATELRAHGIKLPILLLSSFLKEELPAIFEAKAEVTVSSLEELALIQAVARRHRKCIGIHLKFDTGMTRLGAYRQEFEKMIKQAYKSPWTRLCALFTHFASADADSDFTLLQWEKFYEALPWKLPWHVCNSAGLLTLPQAHGHYVRCGLAFYGVSPLPQYKNLFKPALTWKTRVAFVKEVPKGVPVSYGGIYITPRKMRIATLTVGYGDGLMRALSNKGYILIKGVRCPILGNITMDQIMIDVSHVPSADKGSEAVIIGKQGSQEISVCELAKWAETIPYEILTNIGVRVKRVYLHGSKAVSLSNSSSR